ncbi:cupin domain-containing protein [Undibacterium sp. TS12]|uniref:cupin domain-containing protein n=1 Tax=Undibacterium sp. TS12 TaxID=2908202 RepID=UPI001F4CF0B9|nr:cupin domain-containing protein [Undibacterium sp. TS12]MCH8620513.1 cupin domain-containing protein [Undibacterium sp. TS12]
MRIAKTPAIALAFFAGIVASPLIQHAVSDARADAPALSAAVIDLLAIKHDDLPKTTNADLNARTLVTTDHATVGIQSGNVAKHIHPQTDEIQYIIEGSGSMWLGSERKDFKAGSLIVIPKGTAHAGSIVSSGPVKAIAIKIPPQAKGDIVFVD